MVLESIQNYVKKNYVELVLFALLIPLFFINVSSYHDWGDDFAQYLDQTKQFITGEKNIENAVLNYEDICPSHRGSGFSLLLSPVYSLFGHNIAAFLFFISLFFVGTAILVYYFFKSEMGIKKNQFVLALMVMSLFYNCRVMELKIHILPVFVFSFFIYLIFLIYRIRDKKTFHWIGMAILVGSLISIRNLGYCMFLAIIIYHLLMHIKTFHKEVFKQLSILFFVPIFTAALIKFITIGQINYNNVFWYENIFVMDNFKTTVFNNLTLYFNTVNYFFEQEVWGWMNVLMKSSLFFLMILGLLNKTFKNLQVHDVFFLLYLFVLILYPYNGEPYRFLFPILPLIVLYMWHGIQSLQLPFTKNAFAIGFFSLLLFSNFINVKTILLNPKKPSHGPECEEAQDAFLYISKHIDSSEAIAFCKPSALHYYTNRKALSTKITHSPDKVEELMEKHGVSLIMLCISDKEFGVRNPELVEYISSNNQYQELWRNKKFALFKKL